MSYIEKEMKVGFSEVEKYFTSEPSQEVANTKENRFAELFKNENINVKIETMEEENKMFDFCKRHGIETDTIKFSCVSNYVYCDGKSLFDNDEYLIDENIKNGVKEVKVDFAKIEKYILDPMKDKEKQMINLLKDKIKKLPPTKALNLLDHYANGFKEVFSKECISEINNIRNDYAKRKGIEVVNKMFNKNKDVER